MLVFRRITLVLSILMIPLCWGCDNSGSNPDSQGGIEYAGIEFLGNGNDGGDLPASLNPEMGEKVIIPGNSGGLRKDGYSFTGWNTKEDGSGTSFHEGDIFVAKNNPELLIYGSDLLLYAQWSNLSPPPATYSVTYDGNGYTGGKVPVDSTKYLYNQQGEVKGNTGGLVREHFIFIGWNTDQDGKGISYPIDDEGSIDSNNSTFTIDESDLVLYAQWKHVYCYKICYKSDYDNSVPVDYNIYYYGEQCRVKAEDDYGLVQFGIRYKFLGWRILGSSENRLYMPGDYIRVQSNVVFTAEYSAVGGRGPASGLVFFDKGVYTDGWRFLEVALTNQGSSVMWHNSHGSLNLGVSLEAGIGFGNQILQQLLMRLVLKTRLPRISVMR